MKRRYNLLIRFLLTAILMFTVGLASIKIPVSGTSSALTLTDEASIILNGAFQSGDLVLDDIEVASGSFTRLHFQGFHLSNIIGNPELPEMHRLIELPQNAIPRIEVIDEEIEYYNLRDYGINSFIYPHQPSLSKSQDPNDVPFKWNEALYQTDSYK